MWWVVLWLILLVVAMPAAAQTAGKRIALVIGVSHYQTVPALPNPGTDARRVADAFNSLGFDVTLVLDPDFRQMSERLRDFGIRAQQSDAAVVFYAGHGMQVNHENYLLPVDTKLERERDLLYEALPLQLFLGEVAQAQKIGIIILDACRNNPFTDRMTRSVASRAKGEQGLAWVDNVPRNTLVAMATKAGDVALDGKGEDSPFTTAVLASLQKPGLELSLFFRSVRDQVLNETNNRQEPYIFGSLGVEPFYFNAPSAVATNKAAPVDKRAMEVAYWNSVKDSTTRDDFADYLLKYPDGDFASLARRRLAALDDKLGQQVAKASEPAKAPEPPAKAPEPPAKAPEPAPPAATVEPRKETPPPAAKVEAPPPAKNESPPAQLALLEPPKRAPPPPSPIPSGQTALDAYRAQDYETALRQAKPAADLGDPVAQYVLGIMYETGRGLPRDQAQAHRWYEQSAQKGFQLAVNRVRQLAQREERQLERAAPVKSPVRLRDARCNTIVERSQLGEGLSSEDRAFLAARCQ